LAGPAEIERVFRQEYGRCVATLIQDAFTVALTRWPETGLPPNPRRSSR
jgi:RNA polymerase sigma-70 factor (ECF subfamily)